MKNKIFRVLGYVGLVLYCMFASLYLIVSDEHSVGFVVLGFVLAIAFTVHSSVKAYLQYQAKQDRERRAKAMLEALRQERALAEQARLDAIRQQQEALALAKLKAERETLESVAKEADGELLRRARSLGAAGGVEPE